MNIKHQLQCVLTTVHINKIITIITNLYFFLSDMSSVVVKLIIRNQLNNNRTILKR